MRSGASTSAEARRRWVGGLILVLVIASVLRVGALVARAPDPVAASDAAVFDELAWSLARGQGYAYFGRPDASREPGYSLFLAGVYAIFGHRVEVVRWIQTLVGVLIVGMTWLIGSRVWSPPVATVASLLVAADPFLIGSGTLLLTELWFTFILLVAMWFLVTRWSSRRSSDWLIAGGLLGYSALVRGTMLLFPLVLAGVLGIRRGWRAAARSMGCLLLGALVIYGPWAVRNYVAFHAVIPVRIGGGEVVWAGNYLPWDGDWLGVLPPVTTLKHGLDPIDGDRVLLREAWKNIRSDPGAYPALYLRKIPKFWLGIPGTGRLLRDSPRAVHELDAIWVVVLLAMLAGIFMSYTAWPRSRLLLGLLGYFTAIHMPLVAIPRYRLPLDPIIYLFAAVPLVAIGWRRGLREPPGDAHTSASR